MGWTYDAAKLNDTSVGPLMKVRLLVGDTDTNDQQLQDEELAYFLSTEVNEYAAGGQACVALGAKYSRQANKKMGDLSIQMEKIAQHYYDLSDKLFASAASVYAVPTAGGIEVSEQKTNQSDTSVTHSYIRRGMHDIQAPPVVPNSQT